jgi:3'(2'), 5'-bisphosphate nucleotidase
MIKLSNIFQIAIIAAVKAGKATLNYYNTDFEVQFKADSSPITLADIDSNAIIENELRITGIPILSEESKQIEFSERQEWKEYWLVDPLDGTKEFIKKSDEYTVNIALMKDNYPVGGIIYLPAKDILYFGSIAIGAYKLENAGKILPDVSYLYAKSHRLPLTQTITLIIVASRSHLDEFTMEFISSVEKVYKPVKVESYGSSLKFCMIAEGRADVYPRMATTMEWDIAAGHAILESVGFKLLKYPSFTPIEYNKSDLHNPWFVAFNNKYSGQKQTP